MSIDVCIYTLNLKRIKDRKKLFWVQGGLKKKQQQQQEITPLLLDMMIIDND